MAGSELESLLKHLRVLAGPEGNAGVSDTLLLDRFVRARDEAAFEVLVWRYGSMVWNLCRRLLRHQQDAEDAFQAAFLVLACKAGSIASRRAVAGWLYRVAYRIAVEAKIQAEKRSGREKPIMDHAAAQPSGDDAGEMGLALNEEVNRLPEKYRTAVVLCYLQGKTYEEAARLLRCPKGTVAIRLNRAREKLRSRLLRRGVTVSIAAIAVALSEESASASLPALLVHAAVQAVATVAAGEVVAGAVSVQAMNLSQRVIRTMFLRRMQTLIATAAVLCLVGTATTVAVFRGGHGDGAARAATIAAARSADDNDRAEDLFSIPSPLEGILVTFGSDSRSADAPEAKRGAAARAQRLKKGDRVRTGQILARLDDGQARTACEIARKRVGIAEAELAKTQSACEKAQAMLGRVEKLVATSSAAAEEIIAPRAELRQRQAELFGRQEEVGIAKLQLQETERVLNQHLIRSPVDGVITKVMKHLGEAVRQYETVFEIIASEKDK